MSKITIPIGKRFGKLTVIKYAGIINHKSSWVVRCDCGTTKIIAGFNLTKKKGGTKSCGCLRGGITTHGMSNTPEYRIWRAMLNRCQNPNAKCFHNYGERGIKVCERWQSFDNFIADMGRRPSPRHTIERVDNDDNYCPKNCIWATRKKQARNTRVNHILTLDGRTMCITDWSRETGINASTISFRLKSGWSIRRTLTEHPYIGKNQFS